MTSGYATNYCVKCNDENSGLDCRLHSREGNKPVSLVDPKIVSTNVDLKFGFKHFLESWTPRTNKKMIFVLMTWIAHNMTHVIGV